MRTITAEHINTAPGELRGLAVLDFWTDHANTCYWLTLAGRPDDRSLDGCYPKLHTDSRNEYRIFVKDGAHTRVIEIQPTKRNFHFVRSINNGQDILLLAARSEDNFDPNASVYGLDGRKHHEFAAGDGIQNVQITRDDHIWIGYFDEGVFGHTKLGQEGLCLLSPNGKLVSGMNSVRWCIDDCYAFNAVTAEQVHVCPYVDFPLIRWSPGGPPITLGLCPTKGARAFAINDHYVLTLGGYKKAKSLSLIEIEGMRVVRSQFVNMPEGRWYWAFGRGSELIIATTSSVSRLSI